MGEPPLSVLVLIIDSRFERALKSLRARSPSFTESALDARIGLIFETLQSAWTSLEWERARPYLSDNLFQAQRYWIEAYRSSGLRNVTANTRILSIEHVRLTEDRWFDAFTVRLEAKGLDCTIRDANQEVVGGSKRRHHRYTEYWTLVRGHGTSGIARAAPECPSCGAPLEVSMAAVCKHCKAKVNSGKFDWVLARIEQDEAYAG